MTRQSIWQFFTQRDFSHPRYLIALLMALLPVYSYGVYQQWNVNQNLEKIDQSAYMQYSEEIATDFNFRGDHNRMPLYPAIQALHYSPDKSNETFFQEGKALNTAVSMLSLLAISVFFWRIMQPLSATIAIIMTIVFVYPFVTPYFIVEVLFFALFFLCFLLAGYLLLKPSPWLALGLGVLCGLTHLAKGSVLILLVIFLAVYALKALFEYQAIQRLAYHALILLAVVAGFFATIYPYIADTKEVFGSYFYNVNTTFYIWYDSWDEVTSGTRAAGDRLQYPDMPEEDIPSLSKYLREHTPLEVAIRFIAGFNKNFFNHTFKSYGYGKYILAYVILLAGVAWQQRERTWNFIKRHRWLALYIGLIFIAYQTAFAWYVPVSTGKRFLLTLWLPCITVMFWLASHLNIYRFHMIVLAIMVVDILLSWSTKVGMFIH